MATITNAKLDELKQAAQTWIATERTRLNAQYDFLDAISKKRGGSTALSSANSEEASQILGRFITDYLGKPLGAEEET